MNVEDPIYTLSPGDKTSGSVSFTVTASQPGCAADSDTIVLTIQKNPIANAGTSLQICEGESVTISSASAQFSNSTNWTQSGDLGTFINTSSLSPTYNSSMGESGIVNLTLTDGGVSNPIITSNDDSNLFDFENNKIWHKNTIVDWAWI